MIQKTLLTALFLIFSCTPLSADTKVSRSTLADLVQKVHYYTLSNGLRVILYRRDTAPVFSGVIGVRVGGTDEQLGNTGISHMFEHMAFKGTDSIGTTDPKREKELLAKLEEVMQAVDSSSGPTDEQQERIKSINAELKKIWITNAFATEIEKRGATDFNASTDTELTKYYVSLPRTAFEFWCWIESERILHPVMRQFYQERDVVMEERRMRSEDDPGGKLGELLMQVAFLRHPYHNPTVGYEFDIKRLTATMVDEFRKRYYVAKNIVIGIVGDVDPATDLPMLERYFGRIPNAPIPARPNVIEPAQEGERAVVLRATASPQIYIAYRKPQYPDPDDPPLSILNELLAGSKISPLYTELVKKRQLAADIGVEEAPGSAYPNLALFYATPKNPHTNEELLRAFDDVLQKFVRDGVKEESLNIVKRRIALEYLTRLKTSMSLANDIVTAELLYNDWKAIVEWFDKAIAVTSEDVIRVARKYYVSQNRTIARLESLSGAEK